MTKRYLESLPQAEQDDILGRADEWTESAENEPDADDECECCSWRREKGDEQC